MKITLIAALCLGCASSVSAATMVTAIDGTQGWSQFVRSSGSATIANAPAGNPAGPEAVNLTTTLDTNDGIDVFINDGVTTAGALLANNATFSYSYFRSSTSVNGFAAPSLKLTFSDPAFAGDGFGTLVYEPYWNEPGNEGSSGSPVEDAWTTETVSLTDGLFWTTGLFSLPNTAGGPPSGTLADLIGGDSGFQNATLLSIGFGVGTSNQGLDTFFDNVSISGTSVDGTYDFSAPAPIPLPAGLPLLLAGLGGLALMTRRCKRA